MDEKEYKELTQKIIPSSFKIKKLLIKIVLVIIYIIIRIIHGEFMTII